MKIETHKTIDNKPVTQIGKIHELLFYSPIEDDEKIYICRKDIVIGSFSISATDGETSCAYIDNFKEE